MRHFCSTFSGCLRCLRCLTPFPRNVSGLTSPRLAGRLWVPGGLRAWPDAGREKLEKKKSGSVTKRCNCGMLFFRLCARSGKLCDAPSPLQAGNCTLSSHFTRRMKLSFKSFFPSASSNLYIKKWTLILFPQTDVALLRRSTTPALFSRSATLSFTRLPGCSTSCSCRVALMKDSQAAWMSSLLSALEAPGALSVLVDRKDLTRSPTSSFTSTFSRARHFVGIGPMERMGLSFKRCL